MMQAPQPCSTLVFEGTETSAGQQHSRGSRLAQGLRAMGLQTGDVVAVLLHNGLAYADVVHACRIGGMTYCPLNWHFTAQEINFIMGDSGAKALITSQSLLDGLQAALDDSIPRLVVDARAGAQEQDYERWLERQKLYDGPFVSPRGHMAYTSGTTGRPKGVVRFEVPLDELPGRQAMNRRLVETAYGLREGARTLLTAPIYHSAPSLYFQNALMLSELVVLEQRFDPETFLRLVQEHRIDTAYMVPIMYVRLLRLPREVRDRYDLSSLRFVASTGAPCAPEVKKAMIEWLGLIINETYASSESGLVTFIDSQDALAHPGSAGLPLLDARVRILDKLGAPLPAGEVGLIYVRQPAYADFTYRGNDGARRKIEVDGMVTLGDMGYLDEEGFLYVCDRDSDLVISGGVNIYPAEIENELLRHPSVSDCAVLGIPDAEYGERLHALVEAPDAAPALVSELQAWLKHRLAAYKIPRGIEFCTLPRDDNGKIAKRRLREQFWAAQQRKV
ncbi:AMP-binding protein [Alicycliphilus denitrificans]|uniref:AMP-binding protein n=1 Tax=Alicycliphilus denitrificans TaxID=179636 RepID=UPI00384FB895